MRPLIRVAALVLAATLGGLTPRLTQAQTMFQWPAKEVDVAGYKYYEECWVAASRIDSERWRTGRDTMQLTVAMKLERPSDISIRAAQRCSEKFTPATADLHHYAVLGQILLWADRDADFEEWVARKLASIPASSPTARQERAQALDTVLRMCLFAEPVRVACVDKYEAMLQPLENDLSPTRRLIGLYTQMGMLRSLGDTARAARAARRMLAFDKSLPRIKKQLIEEYDYFILTALHEARGFLAWEELLASLRTGTMPYVTLQRKFWTEVTGGHHEGLRLPLGEPAPALTGDFWFAANGVKPSGARPVPGKVNLIFFVGHDCRMAALHDEPMGEKIGMPRCGESYAVVRRLTKRFPTLEVTTVAHTLGYFSRLQPPPPAQEAEFMRRWFLDYHKLPGALTVTQTQFWRLEGLDRRRINRPTENRVKYAMGRGRQIETSMVVITDEEGLIVYSKNISRSTEQDVAAIMDILMQRQSGKP